MTSRGEIGRGCSCPGQASTKAAAHRPLLSLRGVRKSYGDKVRTEVLHGIDFEVSAGEFAAIIGPSGSGKSTLLNQIGLLDRPSSGDILVHGRVTGELDDDSLTALRSRTLGFVFQFHHLILGRGRTRHQGSGPAGRICRSLGRLRVPRCGTNGTLIHVTGAAKKIPTYQDVLDAPSHLVAEILLGRLHLSPRPARRHGRVASVLGMDLGGAFERGRGGPGGWVIFDEPELHLGGDIVVPDLGGWRRERFPLGDTEEAYFVTAPDWVCEILSPSTARYDRTDKLAIYARERVPFVWLVDPLACTLESYALDGSSWKLAGSFRDDVTVHAPPFDAVGLDLGALWLPDASAGA